MKLTNPNNSHVSLRYFVIVLVITWSVPFYALGLSDIKADDIDLDLSVGEFTAKGNVSIDSDEMKLNADEVQAKVEGTLLLSITATGKPLKLEMEIDDDEGEDGTQKFSASANTLTFNNEENWVEFVGDAHVQTDIADIRAHKIRIELGSQKITATKGEDGEQVEITLRNVETP